MAPGREDQPEGVPPGRPVGPGRTTVPRDDPGYPAPTKPDLPPQKPAPIPNPGQRIDPEQDATLRLAEIRDERAWEAVAPQGTEEFVPAPELAKELSLTPTKQSVQMEL
jgi:hypothetical protein